MVSKHLIDHPKGAYKYDVLLGARGAILGMGPSSQNLIIIIIIKKGRIGPAPRQPAGPATAGLSFTEILPLPQEPINCNTNKKS